MKRCANGTRRNVKTGTCSARSNTKRCPNGTRKNKKTSSCISHRRKSPSRHMKSMSFYTAKRSPSHHRKSRKSNSSFSVGL